MKKTLLALGLLLGLSAPALAQVPCIGVGGVNTVPQTGIGCQSEYIVPTYAAVSQGLVPGTAPTDIACLSGSATKVVRVKKIRLSGTAGTAINITAYLTKHVSADTGGTLATGTALPAPYPIDSTFPTVTATAQAWTANPTINDAAPGIIAGQTVFLPVTSTAVDAGQHVWDFAGGQIWESPPVLRGVAQQICVNLNGVTAPSSGLMSVEFYWTEWPQ